MARLNTVSTARRSRPQTHEGGQARVITPEQSLTRSVLSCMLWEKTFYEDGVEIATRIIQGVGEVSPEKVSQLAIRAREEFKLRHVPLLLVYAMTKHKSHTPFVKATLERVIQRPDELTEYLTIYWADGGRRAISAQSKQGLAAAFGKFNEYQLAKYDRKGVVQLRDIMPLCHVKPKDEEHRQLMERLYKGELQTPDTWEVALSGGADKAETFTRLLGEKKLGALALLRNLRNMEEAGVDRDVIREGLRTMRVERVLPFRFVQAAKYAPHLEDALEEAMFRCVEGMEKLSGKTILLVDVSGSMDWDRISKRSELTRREAAASLAVLAREMCEEVEVFTFANEVGAVPNRRGFALKDAIMQAESGGTYLGGAIRQMVGRPHDRLIVFTDEQSHDRVGDPRGGTKAYMVNVASYKYGVGYGRWTHMDGFSEAVMRYIHEYEREFDTN